MKVVEDPFDRDADVDVEEHGAAMGATIECDKKCPHVVAREQDTNLGQGDANENVDILADQMVTHVCQLADVHHITRMSDRDRDLPKWHAARPMLDVELEPLDIVDHDDVRLVVSFTVWLE